MQDSIFTKIINGEIPSHKIYEDEKSFAFLDIHPQFPGHTLLVPKQQIDSIWDLPEDIYHHLWDVARVLQERIKKTTQCERIGVAVEGFGVPHVHIHLIPLNDIHDFKKPQDLTSDPDHEALASMAEKLRAA